LSPTSSESTLAYRPASGLAASSSYTVDFPAPRVPTMMNSFFLFAPDPLFIAQSFMRSPHAFLPYFAKESFFPF